MPTRIVAGQYRHRILRVPPGQKTRPTLARLKESLFSFLGQSVEGSVVCDLFAGCGSLGLEALSRGASRVTFVERDRIALSCIKENVDKLGAGNNIEIVKDDVFKFLSTCSSGKRIFDITFADPVYSSGDTGRLLEFFEAALNVTTLLCLEHDKDEELDSAGPRSEIIKTIASSDKRVSVFRFRGNK